MTKFHRDFICTAHKSGGTRVCARWDTRKPGKPLAQGTASPGIADCDSKNCGGNAGKLNVSPSAQRAICISEARPCSYLDANKV